MRTISKDLILIPAYNEEARIDGVIEAARESYPQGTILVVNDGSSDATSQRARAAGATVIDLCFNLGYGVALQTGFKYARRHGYDYIVTLDGDGQHDPAYIPRMFAEVKKGEADVVIGSRFLGEGTYRAPWARRIGMILFRAAVSFHTGRRISDPTSGYQALSRQVLKLYTSPYYPVDYPDADTLIMLHKAGYRFGEIGVRMVPKADKKSMHSGLKPLYYVFKMALSIFVTLLRSKKLLAQRS